MVIDALLAVLAGHTFFCGPLSSVNHPHMLQTKQLHFSLSAAASISSTFVSCKEASLSSANWDEVKLMYSLLSEGMIMIEW
jgi:hypothetical protein